MYEGRNTEVSENYIIKARHVESIRQMKKANTWSKIKKDAVDLKT